jgi:hypothetical protein
MPSRAVGSDKFSSLLLAKALYSVFKSQINDLAVFINSTELS